MRSHNGAAGFGTQGDKWMGRSHQAGVFYLVMRAGVSVFAQMVKRLTKVGRRVLGRHRATGGIFNPSRWSLAPCPFPIDGPIEFRKRCPFRRTGTARASASHIPTCIASREGLRDSRVDGYSFCLADYSYQFVRMECDSGHHFFSIATKFGGFSSAQSGKLSASFKQSQQMIVRCFESSQPQLVSNKFVTIYITLWGYVMY